MCQILGMNCASPTDFTFSLKGFCKRGGQTDKHAHGWGAAIYENGDLRCFHDTEAACRSHVARSVIGRENPIRTLNMMAHIRYATVGDVSLENVHPFRRQLWGQPISFCHNGECPPFANTSSNLPLLGETKPQDVHYRPMGQTDSEAVFCSLLNALRAEFPSQQPPRPVLFDFLSRLCREISNMEASADTDGGSMPTIFNFLLGCGPQTLFAYSWPGSRPGSKVWNGLHYIVREPPFSTARLIDTGCFIDFAQVTTPNDRVAVITTKPLTDEAHWREVPKGHLVLFEHGKPYWSAQDIAEESSTISAAEGCASPLVLPRRMSTGSDTEEDEQEEHHTTTSNNNCARQQRPTVAPRQ